MSGNFYAMLNGIDAFGDTLCNTGASFFSPNKVLRLHLSGS